MASLLSNSTLILRLKKKKFVGHNSIIIVDAPSPDHTLKIPCEASLHLFRLCTIGPTVDLAAKLCTKKTFPAGVVLQSPLESGGRCILGETASFMLYYLDIFRSYEKMARLAPVPVLIMHGLQDSVVPAANGKALFETLTKAQKNIGDDHYNSVSYPPMWIPDVGHNDMPEFECMQNVAEFLNFLQQRRRSGSSS